MFKVRSISNFSQYKCWSFNTATSEISDIRAFLNHGKSLNGRKYSFSPSNNQNPCADILVTSTSKMFFPAISDFIFFLFYQIQQQINLLFVESGAFNKFYYRFYPKFGFSVGVDNMNMHSLLFPREEEKPVILFLKNCWTHIAKLKNTSTKEKSELILNIPLLQMQ